MVLAGPWIAPARAAPLSLEALDAFIARMNCRERCYNLGSDAAACLAECPPADSAWDKNGDGTIGSQDLYLATLEFTATLGNPLDSYLCGGNPEQPLLPQVYCTEVPGFCYGDSPAHEVVIPPVFCPTSSGYTNCAANPNDPGCADTDGDGLYSWVETIIGTSDSSADASCDGNRDCSSFSHSCEHHAVIADNLCAARDCDGACTAFHLEVVDQNAQELVAHVHYDFSPYPATVLDLRIAYPKSDLQLVDARALPALENAGKSLYTTTAASGHLRLVVLDSGSLSPIPQGAIVELYFLRRHPGSTELHFSNNDYDQQHSMTPEHPYSEVGHCATNPGANCLLADDTLWGSPIRLADVPPGSGHRLLLHYDFANQQAPIAYADVPTAAEICAVYPDCSIAGADPKPRELSRIAILQRGLVFGGESIPGVAGTGIYLNGNQEHLRLPLAPSKMPTPTAPAKPHEQSFTLSFWFYGEGYTANEDPSKPQLLYSQMDESETVHFALFLEQQDDGTLNVVYAPGRYDAATHTTVASAISKRKWYHFALSVDASEQPTNGTAAASAYLDGLLSHTWQITKNPAVACPHLSAARGNKLTPHLVGSSMGGRRPEFVYYSRVKNGLHTIERLDLNAFVSHEVLHGTEFSVRDPDYYAGHDKLLYVSNASGSYEVWVANGDGSDAKQVTVGFGDASRDIAARRPRWSPDGRGIVFESGIYSAGDNNLDRSGSGRLTHLYRIQYNATANLVAVPTPTGGTITQLDYAAELGRGRMHEFRLTGMNDGSHHGRAVWLSGNVQSGTLLYTATSQDLRSSTIKRLDITSTGGASNALGGLDGIEGNLELFDYDTTLSRALYYRPAANDLWQHDPVSNPNVAPQSLGTLGFHASSVSEAVYARGGKEVVVSGSKDARPLLFTMPIVQQGQRLQLDVSQAIRVSSAPTQVEGLRWRRDDLYSACNWLGGIREPQTGRVQWGLRGGLDELKLYSYARSPLSLASEAIRGHEQLAREGRDGLLSATLLPCVTSFDCPAYHLCNAESQCVVTYCNPEEPSSCEVGLCALLPEAIEHELSSPYSGLNGTWACSVECETDAACFSLECENGPCRYCDVDELSPTYTCGECREDSVTVGEYEYTRQVGCPDSLRWACVEGSCSSECYVEYQDENLYVCDQATEACRDARCVLETWSWPDFAPATLSGMANAGAFYRAIPESYPIEIQAFGNGDYLQVPEIVVEGSLESIGGDWFQVGRVAVHNQTYSQAVKSPYIIYTDQILKAVRVRLYTPWSQNIARSACEEQTGPDDKTSCERKTAVSEAQLGYRVEIPRHEINAACEAAGFLDCLPEHEAFDAWLSNSAATVIVTDLLVNNSSIPWDSASNRICPYLDESVPVEVPNDERLLTDPTVGRMVLAGSLGKERSNVTVAYCAQADSFCSDFDYMPMLNKPYGVLNCDVSGSVDIDENWVTVHAGLEWLNVTSIPKPSVPHQHGNITETAASCTVEIVRGSTVVTEHCYEWLSDPSLDPLNNGSLNDKHNTFEYTTFRSFAWSENQ
jgi:hypothetical protein